MSTNEILLPVYIKNILYELYTKYVILSFIYFYVENFLSNVKPDISIHM